MGFVSWAVALLVWLIVWMVTTSAIALIGFIFQITIPDVIVVLPGMLLAWFLVGPWATYLVFDLINKRTSPKWQLHLQKRPIPYDHRVFRDGEVRDIRWEQGWRHWLLYVITAAIWIYFVFFADLTPK